MRITPLALIFLVMMTSWLWSQQSLPDVFWLSCKNEKIIIEVNLNQKIWSQKKPIIQDKYLCESGDALWGSRKMVTKLQSKGCELSFNSAIRFNLWTGNLESNLGITDCDVLTREPKAILQ